MSGAVEVRAAMPADAAALAVAHVACWRQAYAHLLSEDFVAALDIEQRQQAWARRLTTPGPERHVVAAVGEQVVGFGSVGPSADTPPVRELELVGLYLLADHHGGGLGQALLDATIGTGPASLWMAEDNPRARAFYIRNGFAPDGARKVETAWENLSEVRLLR